MYSVTRNEEKITFIRKNHHQAVLVLRCYLAYLCSDVELTPRVCATELLLKPFSLCISNKGHVQQLATKATRFNFKLS